MPEVYLNRGLVYSLMGDNGKAILDVNKALELNPKLVKAYALASDTYIKLNQKSEALAVVTDGLRQVPDSSVLQRLYKERGGKLPYPEPLVRPAEVPVAPPQAARDGETTEAKKSQDAVQLAPASPAPEAAGDGGGRAEGPPPATPKIGSPTNPWCRFCPDPAK